MIKTGKNCRAWLTRETVYSATLGEKNKRPREGAFDFSGGEGGIESLAARAPRQHAATRLRWSNRVLILSHTRREKQKAPRGGL
jgi:hypothetical protein